MSYHRSRNSNLHYPQGFGGILSALFQKSGKQAIRTGEQVEEVESRFKAIGQAIRGKSTYAPPPGPTPETQELKKELEEIRAEQQRVAAERAAEQEAQAAEQLRLETERQALEAQLQQQQAEQASLEQALVAEQRKGIWTRISEAIFGRRTRSYEGLGRYPRRRQMRNVYFQGWHYY